MDFLVVVSDITFGGDHNNWTIDDLKEQFSKQLAWDVPNYNHF